MLVTVQYIFVEATNLIHALANDLPDLQSLMLSMEPDHNQRHAPKDLRQGVDWKT
jgi:hypothetical protein